VKVKHTSYYEQNHEISIIDISAKVNISAAKKSKTNLLNPCRLQLRLRV